MKLYALCTLHEVGWGTRAGVGDAADSAAAEMAWEEKSRGDRVDEALAEHFAAPDSLHILRYRKR